MGFSTILFATPKEATICNLGGRELWKDPEQMTLNCNRPYGLIPNRIMMLPDNNFP
jgi:hypothetical protein